MKKYGHHRAPRRVPYKHWLRGGGKSEKLLGRIPTPKAIADPFKVVTPEWAVPIPIWACGFITIPGYLTAQTAPDPCEVPEPLALSGPNQCQVPYPWRIFLADLVDPPYLNKIEREWGEMPGTPTSDIGDLWDMQASEVYQ